MEVIHPGAEVTRILSKKFPEVFYPSDKKEGGCSADVGLASPGSSVTMEVVTPSDLLLQTPSQCILQEDGSYSCPVILYQEKRLSPFPSIGRSFRPHEESES